MFPSHVPVAPQAPKSIMTLREIEKTSPANAHIMDRFEAGRSSIARVATTVALPNIVVTCTNNGFIQVIDMASGVYRLFVVDLDPKTYVDLPPRCIAIDPTPGLVSAGIGASNAGVREIALVFAPPYSPSVVHASTLTGVVHELISLRSRPSAISIDGDFAVAGDASCEVCAWRSGSFSLLWRTSLTTDTTSASILNVLQHRETCFFSLSNSTVVVCSVRTGTVLTTLLGGGANIAGIVPTPPFADAVVVASTSGSLTVWAPPLKNLGGNASGTVGPQATSLSAIPDSYAGRAWQILNVVDTDMMIKSVSMQNGFLALGGSDGRVALFDATKIAIQDTKSVVVSNNNNNKNNKSSSNLPLLVCFDLDHPILHAGVANDNHFSIVTSIGDVWRWPIEQVIPADRQNNAFSDESQQHLEDKDDYDEYGDNEVDEGNEHDDRNNYYDQGEDPREEEKVPTPDTSRDQDQFIYGGNNNSDKNVARRLNEPSSGKDLGLPPLPQHHHHHHQQQQAKNYYHSRQNNNNDEDDDDEVEDLADSDIVLTDQNNSGISRITSNPMNSTTFGNKNKNNNQFHQQQQQQLYDSDFDKDSDSDFAAISSLRNNNNTQQNQNHQQSKEWYEQTSNSNNKNNNQRNNNNEKTKNGNSNNNNINNNKETVIYIPGEESDDMANEEQNQNGINDSLLNNSASALPRPTNLAPRPMPREENTNNSNISNANNNNQNQQQQPQYSSSSTGGGSSSTPSSRGSQLQQHHSSSSGTSGAPQQNAKKTQHQHQKPHRPVYGSHLHDEDEDDEEEYYEEEEVSPGTTATAESGSSPTNTASTNSDPTKQQQQRPKNKKNTNNNNKEDDENDDDEGVRYHHRDPNSPLKFGNQQQQQQELKNMKLESDLRGLAHGKRMNPKAADAFLQRAVEIQQGRNIANGGEQQQQENEDEGKSFTGSNHPLSKATPQLSQYLREAGKCAGGSRQGATVVLQREDLEEFNLQDYADKHRTLVAALEHKHAIKSQQYKLDDVAFYAEELMLTDNNINKDGEDYEQQQQQQGRISQNMNNNNNNSNNNNIMSTMNDINLTSARKQSPINSKKSTGMPLQDQTNQINNNNGGLISSANAADDLMPATSKKPLVRRVDPVYERQKKLAGPQLHDHLCSDLLIPPMPSTVFFNDKVPNTKEPKSLVLPLPLPSTPLAF